MTDNSFRDFDAMVEEQGTSPDRFMTFKLADQEWTANLRVNAGDMLDWMRTGSKVEAIPALLDALLGEKQTIELIKALKKSEIDFSVMEKVVLWLAEEMGDSGN